MASIKAIAAIALTLMIAAPIGLGYMFASEDSEVMRWETDDRVNLSDTILNSEHPIYMDYTGTTNNSTLLDAVMNYNKVSSTLTAYPMQTVTTHTIEFPANTWVDLSAYPYWEIKGTISTQYYKNGDEFTLFSTSFETAGSTWTISGHGGSLKFTNTFSFTLASYVDNGDYADINAGWKLPLTDQWYTWTNNQTNETVKFLIDLPTNAGASLQGSVVSIARDNDGLVTVTERNSAPPHLLVQTLTLGNYQYILAERNPQGWTFSGLTAWPNMGISYQTFNTIDLVLQEYSQPANFQSTALRTNHIDTTFRVESATVAAGSFPDTIDYTLDMSNLFPEKSYSLKFNSIGIYGGSITIAGETFAPSTGRITVDGATFPLKGAVLTCIKNGDVYDVKINGHDVTTSTTPASITFNGEWSITITADILKQVQYTESNWAPGQFAFDKTDFAACGLLVAGALLVGLGMYGQRSGIKMGLLLLVCGGAALIYLTMI